MTPQEGLSKEDLRKVPQDGLSKLPSGRSAGNTSGRLQEDSRRKASGRYLRKEGLRKVPQEVLKKVSKECLRKTSTKSKYRRSADYLNGTITKLTIRSIWGPWVQYMYREDWRPSESQTCRGLSVRLGNSLHRAENALHV